MATLYFIHYNTRTTNEKYQIYRLVLLSLICTSLLSLPPNA